MPTVTALRARRRDQLEVALDGAPWRVVPTGAAADAGLSIGVELDRERARALNRALRRHAAIGTALRTLRWSTVSADGLEHRLAARRIGPRARREALDRLRDAGLVDDARTAHSRAQALAGRGASNAMIAADLAARGFSRDAIDEAVEHLEPERQRAHTLFERRGADARAARHLAGRGFPSELVEELVAGLDGDT